LLNNSDIRGFVDDRNEKIGKKIRDNEIKKVPFMLIVGEKEEADSKVSVRRHTQGDTGTVSIDEFAKMVQEEIENDFKIKNSNN
jgi:threonyl-tRNA synthetase